MNKGRRNFIQGAAMVGAGLVAAREASALPQQDMKDMPGMEHTQHKTPPPKARAGNSGIVVPMQTPDVPDLPFEMDAGVKVFKLRAEPVTRKLVPFKTMTVWGYNGSCPGPTIQVQQGDRVRVIFENGLPESTTVHWHGLEVPIEMDGVPYTTRKVPSSITHTAPCRK